MQIIWHGQSCFKIIGKDITIITDPYGSKYLSRPFKGKSNVVTISHHHDDHDYIKGIMGDPLIIDTPGEYEIRRVMIKGINSFHDKKQGKERGLNTIYIIKIEDVTICHLGDLGHLLDNDMLGKIGDVDILLIPVGGTYTLDTDDAIKVVNAIEPRMVIPMHYKIPGLKIKVDGADKFIKELGGKNSPISKLKTNKKSLPEEEIEIVVLQKI